MKPHTHTRADAAGCRSRFRGAMRLSLILLGGILAGFILLLAAYALPVERMAQNVLLSVPTFDGSWGSGEESYEQLLKGYQTTQLDNSTDALMLLTAIHPSEEPLIKRTVNVYGASYPYLTLRGLAGTDMEELSSVPIARYWLGFLIFLKPLLLIMTYMDIRMLNMLLQGALLAAIIALMQRRGLSRYLPAFCLSLVCVTPFIVPFSLQFSTVFYIFTIAMFILLWKPEWVTGRLGDSAFFLLIGMATSYFDFLTYPVATFGMPFLLLLVMRERDGNQPLWRMLTRLGASWCFGYFGMWAGKWLLAALFSGEPFWANLFAKIGQRSSLESEAEAITRLDVLLSVAKVFAKKPYLILGVAAATGYGVALFRARGAREPLPVSRLLLFLFVSLLPVVWYFFTGNHTYNHAFFTSRGLIVTVFGLLCLLTRLTERRDVAADRSGR